MQGWSCLIPDDGLQGMRMTKNMLKRIKADAMPACKERAASVDHQMSMRPSATATLLSAASSSMLVQPAQEEGMTRTYTVSNDGRP